VRLLLDAGANVNAQNGEALCKASYKGHTEVVRLLLDKGADFMAQNVQELVNDFSHRYPEVKRLLQDAADNANALRVASSGAHIQVASPSRKREAEDHIEDRYEG
jgi:ankyrin repeat protein